MVGVGKLVVEPPDAEPLTEKLIGKPSEMMNLVLKSVVELVIV